MNNIQQIKKEVVNNLKKINPKKIILFGSFGTDKFQPGKSDIDLLIIQETDKKPIERFSGARLALSSNYPFDLFVLTPNEFQKEVATNFFFQEIVEKGEVLYEQ